MIIGKSLTALGGGGLKPEIRVTANAGALLNLRYKDSSIILQSYQLVESETQHTFVVDVSKTAYVVEDVTNGASVEVLVDSVARYSVEIEYVPWLYKDGDECTDITGGWISSGKVEKNDTYVNLKPNYGSESAITTVNEISLSGYTKLFVDGHGLREDYPNGTNIKIIIGSTVVGEKFTYNEGRHIDSFDISFEGSYKIALSSANGRTGYIYKIWLE